MDRSGTLVRETRDRRRQLRELGQGRADETRGATQPAEGAEGQGIGQALLNAAEAAAGEHGAQTITLHVFSTNSRARRLYERSGYDGELIRYIKPISE